MCLVVGSCEIIRKASRGTEGNVWWIRESKAFVKIEERRHIHCALGVVYGIIVIELRGANRQYLWRVSTDLQKRLNSVNRILTALPVSTK